MPNQVRNGIKQKKIGSTIGMHAPPISALVIIITIIMIIVVVKL